MFLKFFKKSTLFKIMSVHCSSIIKKISCIMYKLLCVIELVVFLMTMEILKKGENEMFHYFKFLND